MSMSVDQILDRQKLSRSLLFWRVVAIIALVGLIGVSLSDDSDGFKTSGLGGFGPYIARVEVTGVIMDDPYRDQRLMEIKNDPRAKALVVRIDSPGGSVVGGEMLFKNLRDIASVKPVVAVMGELATSAGYMAAIGADYVLAREGSITGSIGVIMQTADITDLLDKIGVKPEVVKSADLKATPNPFEPFTKEQREAARDVVISFFDYFKVLVAERRGFDVDTIEKLSDGRVFTGRQALDVGLIDAIGGEQEARMWLAVEKGIDRDIEYREVDLEPEIGNFARLFKESLGISEVSERLSLDGLISLWQPNIR